ncbi:hypothetical protein D3C86_2083960 [compost metagenome]
MSQGILFFYDLAGPIDQLLKTKALGLIKKSHMIKLLRESLGLVAGVQARAHMKEDRAMF